MKRIFFTLLLIFLAFNLTAQTGKTYRGDVQIKGDLETLGDVTFTEGVEYTDVMHTLADTVMISYQFGHGNAGDAGIFTVGSMLASSQWENYIMFHLTKVKVVLDGTSPDIDIQLYKSTDMGSGTPTSMLSSDLTCTSTTTGNSTLSFANDTISTGDQFWVEVTEATTAPTFCNVTLYGYYERGEGGVSPTPVVQDTAAVSFTTAYADWTTIHSYSTDVSINSEEGWTGTCTADGEGDNGYYPGPYPDQVCDGYVYTSAGTTTFVISGLDDGTTYDVDILLSRESISERINTVTVGDAASQNIDVNDNTTVLNFTGVNPSSGSITITSEIYGGATYTYMNALVIREN